MKRLLTNLVMILLVIAGVSSGCKKEKKENTVPSVSTSAVTGALATTAMGGGNITSDGGSAVTAIGLCFSKTVNMPTIANDTTRSKATSGSFTSQLKNLTPSSTYYVRAYATNSIGTAYGEVVTFSTGNGGPVATNVVIAGNVAVGERLTVSYTYTDAENDVEDVTAFQWYKANDAQGTGEVAIAGATTNSYKILPIDEFKYLRVGITAKAKTGTAIGPEVKSAFTSMVGAEPSTVTFTYNGKQVTYGIITSSVTGRKWMDRNLGAPNVAISSTDFANFGDLFQFGRAADGHQLLIRASTDASTTAVNGTSTDLSAGSIPGHSLFILASANPVNWTQTLIQSLWASPNYLNNPCPSGWHIPTKAEWTNENIILLPEAFAQLKLTMGGTKSGVSGSMSGSATYGQYWTMEEVSPNDRITVANFRNSLTSSAPFTTSSRAQGNSCRCIKNE